MASSSQSGKIPAWTPLCAGVWTQAEIDEAVSEAAEAKAAEAVVEQEEEMQIEEEADVGVWTQAEEEEKMSMEEEQHLEQVAMEEGDCEVVREEPTEEEQAGGYAPPEEPTEEVEKKPTEEVEEEEEQAGGYAPPERYAKKARLAFNRLPVGCLEGGPFVANMHGAYWTLEKKLAYVSNHWDFVNQQAWRFLIFPWQGSRFLNKDEEEELEVMVKHCREEEAMKGTVADPELPQWLQVHREWCRLGHHPYLEGVKTPSEPDDE